MTDLQMRKDADSRVVINDPFAKRLMVRYLSRRTEDIAILRAALDAGDYASIEEKGHNLFGSGSAYGLDPVSEIGAALEKKARDRNGDAIAELIERLEAFIRNVRLV